MVVLFPSGTVGGCEVRGGAPGTIETALLSPYKTVSEIHALLLTPGSAYGLAAADGVIKYKEKKALSLRRIRR